MKHVHKRDKGKKLMDIVNNEWGRIIFFEKVKRFHIDKHPELNDGKFLQYVRNTIQNPELIYKSLINRDIVFYNKIGKIDYSLTARYKIKYSKVVINFDCKPGIVRTAFGQDYIKEKVQIK